MFMYNIFKISLIFKYEGYLPFERKYIIPKRGIIVIMDEYISHEITDTYGNGIRETLSLFFK